MSYGGAGNRMAPETIKGGDGHHTGATVAVTRSELRINAILGRAWGGKGHALLGVAPYYTLWSGPEDVWAVTLTL